MIYCILLSQVSDFDSLPTWAYIFLNLSAFKHFGENLSNIIKYLTGEGKLIVKINQSCYMF